MTEPENFDDELFADLYNDDDATAKPAPVSEPDQNSAVQPAAPESRNERPEDTGQRQDYDGGHNTQANHDEEVEEEDDDEIDFNLGNGPSATVKQEEKPMHSTPPAPAAPAKGPNAKEDGWEDLGSKAWGAGLGLGVSHWEGVCRGWYLGFAPGFCFTARNHCACKSGDRWRRYLAKTASLTIGKSTRQEQEKVRQASSLALCAASFFSLLGTAKTAFIVANMPENNQFWVVRHTGPTLSPCPDFIPLESSESDSSSLTSVSSPPAPKPFICHDFQDDDRMDLDVDAEHEDTKSDASNVDNDYGPNGSCENRKMFIGGLNWETTDQSLRDYFSQFGEVVECTVMRDGATGRSRGFGFLTFKDPKTVNIVMVKEHYLDGKIIDPKRAIPRDEQEKTSKIFVGGVSQETTDHEFREYFAQFGRVVDATLMMDKDTGRPRGFGFVTFESEAGVEACLSANLEIHGKPIEVKKAQPRGNLRDEEDAARRGGKFGRKGQGMGGGMDDGSGGQGAMGMGGMGPSTAGMSPQVMAQYIQRMQQAFAMMQQQMMMNRNMNPNFTHMMYMQQMQQMQQMMAAQQGRGGPGGMPPGMANMNPAMMQQQMQQMQQMMNQAGGAGGPGMNQGGMSPGGGSHGGAGSSGSGGGGSNRGSYGGYEQQQFDQQQGQPGQGQGRRGGRGAGGGDMHHQQGYGQGGFGGGQGGPTSWEGMYDDVPQPIMNQVGGGGFGGGGRGGFHKGSGRGGGQQMMSQGPVDPGNAPPPNAPTGPKNAGRPGANYRGGGRGGNRGFHPYARS
ncbi:hypothetical protein C8A03DRAFT_41547 [Achaetomium macrosporum]|uniref:RRM domain-containing protein n=2 Tax=Sordariales TaxID=5139 RepID=A0AAN7CFC9_9PEZI|nr:hypothetical protein C8A03DRAFT_41547 [Achaetomium macrosporum]